tara:strand:- start:68 stop:1423 length:1356 start_codon:yes stop_codon:yes gene_type:complete
MSEYKPVEIIQKEVNGHVYNVIEISKLHKHPLNSECYKESRKVHQEHVKGLETFLEAQLENTLEIPNYEALIVDLSTGVVYRGNTTLEASEKVVGAKYLKVESLDSIIPGHRFDPNSPEYDEDVERNILNKKFNIEGKRNEFDWVYVMDSYASEEKSKGRELSSTERTQFGKDHHCQKELPMLRKVMNYDKKKGTSHIEELENSPKKLKDRVKWIEGQGSDKDESRKELFFTPIVKTDPKFNSLLLKYFKSIVNQIENIEVEDDDIGGKVKIMKSDHISPDSNGITGMMSFTTQSVVPLLFRKSKYVLEKYGDLDARSPQSSVGAPDCQLHGLNEEGFFPVVWEEKLAQMAQTPGKTAIYGLAGITSMIDHEFLIGIRQGFDRWCIFSSVLTRKDFTKGEKTDSGYQEAGKRMTMNRWFENHFDNKNEWHCIHGEIRKTQEGKIEIITDKL